MENLLQSAMKRPWCLPVMASILIHWPALLCGFVYDDIPLVQDNSALSSGSYLQDLWKRDYGVEFSGVEQGYFRPVLMLLVFTVHKVAGPSPFAFHFLSLAVFSLAVFIFTALAGRLLPTRPAAVLFASVLYAVHPARVETVSLVMSLPDLVVETAVMLSLMLLTQERGSLLKKSVMLFALGLAAALTKESAFFLFTAITGTTLIYAAIHTTKSVALASRGELNLAIELISRAHAAMPDNPNYTSLLESYQRDLHALEK